MTGGAVEVLFQTFENESREQVERNQNIYDTVINKLIQTGEAENFLRDVWIPSKSYIEQLIQNINAYEVRNILKDNLVIEQGINEGIDKDEKFEDLSDGNLDDLESARFNISFQ